MDAEGQFSYDPDVRGADSEARFMSSGTSGRRSALDVTERRPSAGLPASAKIAVVLVGGLSITLVAFLATHRFERRRLDAEFERMAGIHIEAVRRHLDTQINALGAVGGLLDVSEHVDRDQFERFTTPLLASATGLKAISWIPRVTAKERIDFERQARLEGFDRFTITEEGPDDLIPAAERAVYFPVSYLVPYVGNKRALGFDLLSDPTRREALELARQSGRAVATAGITLVQETGHQHSVLIFLPLYRPVPLPGEGGSQQGDFYGLISGVLRLGDVLNAALADITPGNIDVALIDRSAGGAM
ncbi:MAG: CHASE domain-containing protein, partial [Phycisphaerales bacterium]